MHGEEIFKNNYNKDIIVLTIKNQIALNISQAILWTFICHRVNLDVVKCDWMKLPRYTTGICCRL